MRCAFSLLFLLPACSESHPPETDPDGDADADADGDADADADGDADGDADVCFGACDAESCCNPPWDGSRHCTDISTDWGNCGGCGRQCGEAQYCEGGHRCDPEEYCNGGVCDDAWK